LIYKGDLPSFDKYYRLPIIPDYISLDDAMKIEGFGGDGVLVYGILSYQTDNGENREVKFSTIYAQGGFGGGEGPEYFYELFLEAGKSGYSKFLPVSHSVKPGEAEHFVVRIGTDKSANFDLLFTLKDTSGKELPSEAVNIEIFIPRTFDYEGTLKQKPSKWSTL